MKNVEDSSRSAIAISERVDGFKLVVRNRVIGTGLPGVVVLGHFRKSKKRMMVYWVRGQQALILDLKTGPYKRMIIGCADAKALAKELELGV